MKRKTDIGLDFIIDKLTNSIENIVTGDSFAPDISLLTKSDLKTVSKTNGWLFNWRDEFKEPARDVFKLTIVNNAKSCKGLLVWKSKKTTFICTWLKAHLSIKVKRKCIRCPWQLGCLCLQTIFSAWARRQCVFYFKNTTDRTLRKDIGCFSFRRTGYDNRNRCRA
jgi:hypothetical protein